jgi:hypothetical protein
MLFALAPWLCLLAGKVSSRKFIVFNHMLPELAKAIQSSSPILSLLPKTHFSQQGASSSGIPLWEADSISQPRVAEKTTRGRDSPDLSHEKPVLFIELASPGATGCGIPPQGASSLAYLWMGSQ